MFNKTVDSIMAAHIKTIDELEKLAGKKEVEASNLDKELEALIEKRNNALKESARATTVACSFRSLINNVTEG